MSNLVANKILYEKTFRGLKYRCRSFFLGHILAMGRGRKSTLLASKDHFAFMLFHINFSVAVCTYMCNGVRLSWNLFHQPKSGP